MADLSLISTSGSSIDPSDWDTFIEGSPQGAVFLHHGYMSIIAPGWQALIVKEGDRWVGVLPLGDSSKYGLTRSLQPHFSQYWGICFARNELIGYQNLSWQKSVIDLMLPQLSAYRQIIWHFSPAFGYPLPFHWAGFTLQSRFTYQIDLNQPEETLLSVMASTTRRYLRKGEGLQVEESGEAAEFLGLFAKQRTEGHEIISSNDHDQSIVTNLIAYLRSEQKGKLLLVRDQEGQLLAGGLFGMTNGICTYLLGTYDPSEGNRSAMPLMMWTMIREAQEAGMRVFDFEGSMLEGVERFFRRMGGQPVPYLRIEKNELPLLIKWISALRS